MRRFANSEANFELNAKWDKIQEVTQQAAKITLDLQSHEGSNSNLVQLYEDWLIKSEVKEGLVQGATLNS
jgi:hypothetical protein